MKQIIFSTLKSDGTVRVIAETGMACGAYRGHVRLSAIDVPPASLIDFQSASAWTGKTARWTVLERCEVDRRNQGPRSKYGRTLAAMKKEALTVGAALGDEQEIRDVGLVVLFERCALRQAAGLDAADEPALPAQRRKM